ncbi:MAG: sugar ABC transporter permease [SAR324 cluster bacterium]|nr:sugar ABC transporter permease [SAR324 cluster bacterium]
MAGRFNNMQMRQRVNFVIFLGPAIVIIFLFYIAPIIVDLGMSFTDMGKTLKVEEYFTLKNYYRMFTGDRRLAGVMFRTLLYVLVTLTIFNTTFGLVLALVTTSVPERSGAFFRAIWLLPRMSPAVVYALLWAWVIDPTERGLLNQVLHGLLGMKRVDMFNDTPILLIVFANGFIGASMGMIIFTSAIRAIPEHLFFAARADGAGGFAIAWHITLPALYWPLAFITIYQTLSLLTSFEYILLITDGGPFRDTMVYALYIYKRAFEFGDYAYGATLALALVVIGIITSLLMWRFMNMQALLQRPRIEVH